MRIDEAERRRADFLGGVPVRLADGREWTLPRPKARFAFASDGYEVQLSCGPGSDAEDEAFRGLYDRYAAFMTGAEATDREFISVQLAMGAALLRRNYRLSDEELKGLLVFSFDEADEPYYTIGQDVMAVATGRSAPKA